MIEKWFEPFTLLDMRASPDGLGGSQGSFTPVMTFSGVITLQAGSEVSAAGQHFPAEASVLLHESDVTLVPNDVVRRERDSSVYRVTSRTDSMRSPAFSGLRFAQVGVEKAVLPC